MKSILSLLFLAGIFFSYPLHAQVEKNTMIPEIKLLDSVYRYDWDDHNTVWVLTQKQFKIKNGTGQLADDQTLNYDSSSSQWIVTKKIMYQYFSGSDSVSLLTGQILNTQVDTFGTYLYTHYTKPGLPDEYFLKIWDQATHQFNGGSRTLTAYNNLDTVTQVIQQVLNTSSQTWVNASRDTYTHDTSNFLTQRLLESWAPSASSWINNYRWTFTHDGFNNLTGVLEESWDLQGSAWRNASRTTVYVKTTGRVDSLETDSWSQGPQIWIPGTRSYFIYSVDGLVYNKRDQAYNTSSQTWLDSYLTLYTYFYSGPLIKTITGEFWKPATFNWIKNSIYSNDSAGHNIEVYKKYWDPGTYEFTGGYRNAWFFDASGNNTDYLSQNYDPGIGTWANNSQDLYSYDTDSHLSEDLYQVWNSGLDDWMNNRKYVYYYNEFIGIGEIRKDKPCFHANPVHAGSPVNCPFFSPGSTYELSMYSVSGALVYSETFTGGETILIGNGLPEGLYLLSIKSGGKEVYRDKVILVK